MTLMHLTLAAVAAALLGSVATPLLDAGGSPPGEETRLTAAAFAPGELVALEAASASLAPAHLESSGGLQDEDEDASDWDAVIILLAAAGAAFLIIALN